MPPRGQKLVVLFVQAKIPNIHLFHPNSFTIIMNYKMLFHNFSNIF